MPHCGMPFRSLCLIDEFGKGTLSSDGIGLLCSTLQHFVRGQPSPKVIACTHYSEVLNERYLPRWALLQVACHVWKPDPWLACHSFLIQTLYFPLWRVSVAAQYTCVHALCSAYLISKVVGKSTDDDVLASNVSRVVLRLNANAHQLQPSHDVHNVCI